MYFVDFFNFSKTRERSQSVTNVCYSVHIRIQIDQVRSIIYFQCWLCDVQIKY